jgi:glucokinase
MTAVLSFDLGGTNLRASLAQGGREGDAAALGRWPAPPDLASFQHAVASLIAAHGASRIGLAIPGLASGTTCVWVPNLPYLDGQDLTRLFPGVAVALGNDAHFALLAESALGAARDFADAILVAIGTGVGSAVMVDGRIVRGFGGAAASFGWACADPLDNGDGAHGWLERHAAGPVFDAIARRAGLADGRALIAAARAGDPAARERLETPCAALGATLAGPVAMLGSQSVIISGGLADSVDALGPLILRTLRRHLPPHLRAVRLAPAHFGARASLVGAGLAASDDRFWTRRRP